MELSGLAGKTAVVTGASRGIGRAIAKTLASAGARVVCCARSQDQLIELCAEIEDLGGAALAVTVDVTKPDDRERLIAQAAEAWGSLDILVNNAGIHTDVPALELDDDKLNWVMEVNFFSMFALSRGAAAHMIDAGGGKIVNMGSFWGQKGGEPAAALLRLQGGRRGHDPLPGRGVGPLQHPGKHRGPGTHPHRDILKGPGRRKAQQVHSAPHPRPADWGDRGVWPI